MKGTVAAIIPYLRWLKSLLRRTRDDLNRDLWRQEWWSQGVSIDPTAIVRLGRNASLEIGSGTMIGAYTIIDLLNDPLLDTSIRSELYIGRRTSINEFSNIRAASGVIVIGDNCLIAQFVSIIAANHSLARDKPIRDQPADLTRNSVNIGNDVWIGAHAVILPGVTIGNGAVVAAGAVVTHEVSEHVMVAGVPAQIKHNRLR